MILNYNSFSCRAKSAEIHATESTMLRDNAKRPIRRIPNLHWVCGNCNSSWYFARFYVICLGRNRCAKMGHCKDKLFYPLNRSLLWYGRC